MAKRTDTVALKGKLENGLITEETKESLEVYDLNEILADFEGEEISIMIKKELRLPRIR